MKNRDVYIVKTPFFAFKSTSCYVLQNTALQEEGGGHPKEGLRSLEQLVSRVEGSKAITSRVTGTELPLDGFSLMKIHGSLKEQSGHKPDSLGQPAEVAGELT